MRKHDPLLERIAALDPLTRLARANAADGEALLARILIQPALEARPPAPSRQRGWPRRRTLTLVACALVAAVATALAAPALGLRDELVRLFDAGPPPAAVQTLASQLDPGLRSSGARALIELRTSVGAHVILWTSSGEQGSCLGLSWPDAERPGGDALCGREHTPDPLLVSESGHRVNGAWIALDSGRVSNAVHSLRLVASDGRSVPVAMQDGFFLVEVPPWRGHAFLVAYDASGAVLAKRQNETDPAWLPPDPVGPREILALRRLAGREWSLYSYRARTGRRCYGLAVRQLAPDQGERNNGAGDAFRCLEQAAIDAAPLSVSGPARWPGRPSAASVTSVFGLARADVAELRLVFADGSSERLVPRNGAFLYLDESTGRGDPVRADAYGGDGKAIVSEPLR